MSTFEPPPTDPALNPYAAPDVEIGRPPVGLVGDLAEAEATRRAYLGHEMSVKSLGLLHLLGAFFGIIGMIAMVVLIAVPSELSRQAGTVPVILLLITFYAFMTGLNLALGLGLRKLRNWARWTETALLSLYLVGILISMIVGLVTNASEIIAANAFALLFVGYFLYLLVSPKASVIFSPHYQAIIAQTPHIKYRTSLVLKILVALIVLVVILAVVGAIISRVFVG